AIYKAKTLASIGFYPDSAALATRTIKRAPRTLHQPPNGCRTPRTRLPRPIVNPESLLVKTRIPALAAIVKQPVPSPNPGEIKRDLAPRRNRPLQHLPNRPPQPLGLFPPESLAGEPRRNPGPEQGLARINVPHSGHQPLIEQLCLDRLA